MNKFISFIIFTLFPFYSFAVSNTDIYSQQQISGTFIESGYADTFLQKNARNTVIDIVSRNIIDYILDNTDDNTAKTLSINMPADMQICDDEYNTNIDNEMNLYLADDILHTCMEALYSKNLSYIIKETATINKGSYYFLLENIFKNHTKEFLNIKDFNIDDFINKMAIYNLLSFDGRPFYNKQTNIKLEDIKCENNHIELAVLDDKTKLRRPISEFNINGSTFHIKACLNKNNNSYFKYILLYIKNNDTYTLYARLPVFYNLYTSFNKECNTEPIGIALNNTTLTIRDKLHYHTWLSYNYTFLKKNIYLTLFRLSSFPPIEDDKTDIYIEDIFVDKKYTITPLNMSLKLYQEMIKKYCKNNIEDCLNMQIEKIIPNLSSN